MAHYGTTKAGSNKAGSKWRQRGAASWRLAEGLESFASTLPGLVVFIAVPLNVESKGV